MPNSKTPQELIVEIERKDRRFRMAQSVFMVLLLAAVAALLFMQMRVIHSAEYQITAVKDYLKCAALTPVEERTPDFVDKCFAKD